MKRIRIRQWHGHLLLARPQQLPRPSFLAPIYSNRPLSTASTSALPTLESELGATPPQAGPQRRGRLPSPRPSDSLRSPKLAALHARLSLPERFPLQTLARTLVDKTADGDAQFNNRSLSILGSDVMGYYMSEHLVSHYPRLPMDVLFAAQEAFVGPKALMTVAKEWGVEEAVEPGGEVDPGLLQFRQPPPGIDPYSQQSRSQDELLQERAVESQDAKSGLGRANLEMERFQGWRRSMSSRIVYDDQFGEAPKPELVLTTRELAHSHFVRAVVGALQLLTGREHTKKFFQDHILSRVLNLSQLFDFRYPTRDLSRLCLREGFERPIARLISETGRHSSHPVFVVGVYSGRDKLGEAAGASLAEAKNRAAAAALKGWYLYSPQDVMVPSETEGGSGKAFKANLIDPGEIIT